VLRPATGEPVHRRTLRIAIGAAREGQRAVHAHLLDWRYRGVSRVGSHVRRPGPIHDMTARFNIDPEGRALAQASAAMALAAFDGTPDTGFQSCRDILPNVAALAGTALDVNLVAAIRRGIGRERGCYHLTTLILAAAPVLQRIAGEAIGRDEELERELVLEALHLGGDRTRFEGALRDRGPGSAERTAQLGFTVAYADPCALDVRAPGAPEVEQRLQGAPLATGFAREALARLADVPACAAQRELALGLSAIFTQGMLQSRGAAAVPVPAGRAHRAFNTCWMWRDGGPLQGMSSGLGDE
jgi:hypothetical protein